MTQPQPWIRFSGPPLSTIGGAGFTSGHFCAIARDWKTPASRRAKAGAPERPRQGRHCLLSWFLEEHQLPEAGGHAPLWVFGFWVAAMGSVELG